MSALEQLIRLILDNGVLAESYSGIADRAAYDLAQLRADLASAQMMVANQSGDIQHYEKWRAEDKAEISNLHIDQEILKEAGTTILDLRSNLSAAQKRVEEARKIIEIEEKYGTGLLQESAAAWLAEEEKP